MPRVNFVKKARKEIPSAGIKVGDSYYWWKFRYGGKQVSKTRPRNSQLTQSDFLCRTYQMAEQIEDLSFGVDFQEFKDSLLSDIEEIRDEQEEKKDNMPERLQESPTAELLQERYDTMDEFYTNVDNIDIDIDPDADEEEKEELIENIIQEFQAAIPW